jgi:hypothetical protein
MTELLTEIAALAVTGIYIVGRLSARLDSVEVRLGAVEAELKNGRP